MLPRKEKSITEASLTPEQKKAIVALQRHIRTKHAFEKIKEATDIDIEKTSAINMQALRERLITGNGLPEATQKLIQQEKLNKEDLLTSAELQLYKRLLDRPLLINHATDNAIAIVRSGSFFSSRMLAAKNISVRKHTPSDHAEDNYIFFSYGYSPNPETVNFLASSDFFVANFDVFAQKEPAILAGTWTSGHFYAYDQEQIAQPITFKINDTLTRVNTHYEINYTPLPRYTRHYDFHYDNGDSKEPTVWQQTLQREEEIICGKDIKPYHALRLIEYLRLLSPEIRAALLKAYKNDKLINQLFDAIFSPGKAELHIPQIFPYDANYTTLEKRSAKRRLYSDEIKNSILRSDIETLKKYLKMDLPLKHYLYSDNQYEQVSLLHLAVLKQDEKMTHLLLKYGLDSTRCYINKKQQVYLSYSERTALQDAIESKNDSLIRLLTNPGGHDNRVCISYRAYASQIDMYTAIADKLDKPFLDYLLQHYQGKQSSLDKLLMFASYYNNTIAIELLIRKGANPNVTNKIGQSDNNAHLVPLTMSKGTALSIAAEHGHLEAVKVLLDHGANPNAYIKKEGNYEKKGKSDSPLMTALDGLINIPNNRNDCYKHGKIDNPRYRHLVSRNTQDYIEIIKSLLDAGADIHYQAGDKSTLLTYLQKYFDKAPKTPGYLFKLYNHLITKQQINNNLQFKFNYRNHAIITAVNKENEKLVLLATTHDNKSWQMPGGKINYLIDEDNASSIINLTAFQTGIDLAHVSRLDKKTYRKKFTKAESSLYSNSKKLVRTDKIEKIHHYHLSESVEKYKLKTHTPLSNHFSDFRSHDNIKRLHNMCFVKLKELIFTFVTYKNVLFPICHFQGKQLPIKVSVKLAELCELKNIDFEQAHLVANELSCGWLNIMKNAIYSNDLNTIGKCLALGIGNFYDLSSLLLSALESKQFEVAAFLLERNLQLHKGQILRYFEIYNDSCKDCPVQIARLIYEKHHSKLNEYVQRNLAYYAGRVNAQDLVEKLYLKDPKNLSHAMQGAIQSYNTEIFTLISTSISAANIPDFFEKNMHELKVPKLENSKERNLFLNFIQKCMEQVRSDQLNKALLNLFVDLLAPIRWHKSKKELDYFINNAAQLEPLFIACLQQMKALINECHISGKDFLVYDLYFIYKGITKLYGNETLAKQYFDVFSTIPMVAMKAAMDEKNTVLIDDLLGRYQNDREMIKYISKDNYGDLMQANGAGDDCLQRAVKANAMSIVSLLLQHCKGHFEFNIDCLDKNGYTPLANAIKLGHLGIATVLHAHGGHTYSKKSAIESNGNTQLTSLGLWASKQVKIASDEPSTTLTIKSS